MTTTPANASATLAPPPRPTVVRQRHIWAMPANGGEYPTGWFHRVTLIEFDDGRVSAQAWGTCGITPPPAWLPWKGAGLPPRWCRVCRLREMTALRLVEAGSDPLWAFGPDAWQPVTFRPVERR